jgi:hypothetical protein
MAFGFLKKIAKVALPIAGTALLGPAGGALGGALGGAISGGGVGGALGGAAAGGLSGLALKGGIGGLGGKLAKLGISPAQAAQLGLAGLGVAQGAQQQGKANQINQQLLGQLQAQSQAREPLRKAAVAKLLAAPPSAPDLGNVFQSSNPFAARMAAPQAPQQPFTPMAMQGQPLAMPSLSPIQARLARVSGGPGPRMRQT